MEEKVEEKLGQNLGSTHMFFSFRPNFVILGFNNNVFNEVLVIVNAC